MLSRVLARPLMPRGLRDPEALHRSVSGRVVLVTGASYGVGAATARQLGAAGAHVLLLARTADRLAEVAAAITAAGGTAVTYPADLRDTDAIAAVAQRIAADLPRIDVVISNAGKSIHRSVLDSYDRFHDVERTLGVNYLGAVRLLLTLLPGMGAAGGHLVHVSSTGVRLPPAAGWAAYEASKSAFDQWGRSVAHELRGVGITTTTVYLPLVHNRMSAPTPALRRVPGLSSEQAADVVARAVVRRPRSIAPWWLLPAETVSVLARNPIEAGLSAFADRSARRRRG
jgi:NAD(P)-dependent dehydrogenase (short-subunit alcohol dehydrogenase family)